MSNTAEKLDELEMTIQGVEIKELKTNSDQRGFFREVIRVSDPFFQSSDSKTGSPENSNIGQNSSFGQWSHSKMEKDVVKAWHYHHVQIDWWYVAIGTLEVVLFDNREESPTYKNKMNFYMGESSTLTPNARDICVKIPPGVLHGCKVVTPHAHLFYITSVTYNPNEEGRFPYNSPLVGHDWGEHAIVADNDKRTFVPTSKRQLIS